MIATLRLILGDQLSPSITALQDLDPVNDVVMLCEVQEEATYVRHHPKKIAFLLAAMRHFAEELRSRGWQVRYIPLEEPANTGSFDGEVKRAVDALRPTRLVLTEPGEYRVKQKMLSWQATLACPVEIRPDQRFLCSVDEFRAWCQGKKQLRMEYFYREMRKKYALLLENDGKPTGGVWNFDKENRSPPRPGVTPPPRLSHPQSPVLREVMPLVRRRFGHHFGDLEPFHLAVTREQAERELDYFLAHYLPNFGEYQDAMSAGDPFLFHSRLSAYLNAGLLLPLDICRQAEAAYRKGQAPLAAVEGFIRQILGWREYVRGIYWQFMPQYGQMNHLQAKEPLPEFYWTGNTRLHCLAEAVRHTREHAYSHHIQRLMITGNFALLAALDVQQVQEWYLAVYADAYEWVEMPNTLGMALYGDGGLMASKPYAASGKYIHRMSNYCASCVYHPENTTGEKACPFNSLYWDFLARHSDLLRTNPRLSYAYATWDKFSPPKQQAIREQAAAYLQQMRAGTL